MKNFCKKVFIKQKLPPRPPLSPPLPPLKPPRPPKIYHHIISFYTRLSFHYIHFTIFFERNLPRSPRGVNPGLPIF